MCPKTQTHSDLLYPRLWSDNTLFTHGPQKKVVAIGVGNGRAAPSLDILSLTALIRSGTRFLYADSFTFL
jgi:hypothetical protein